MRHAGRAHQGDREGRDSDLAERQEESPPQHREELCGQPQARLGPTGTYQVQKLTKAHLDKLVDELAKSGRRVGNVKRQGLSPRSINLMLTLLSPY
jgi:hypothetical protein